MIATLDRINVALEGRYTIERELGHGGTATVYLGQDLKNDREVAIKVFQPELAASIGGDRFEREIRLAAKLQHPHILGLYDSGDAAGLLFYVMPYVRGESLRDRLEREGQLPIDDAIQITLEVADALGYAHVKGIIHRDIKPENILLTNGHALVADFGIAKAVSEGDLQKLTPNSMVLGTPTYMAPEQAAGEAVGPPADIYSLGCLLYEMLAGEPPFAGPSAHAILARHAMESVPSIRIVRGAVPEEVEDAIFAAMMKSPGDRPQTAAKFAEFFGFPMRSTASRRAGLRQTASRSVPSAGTLTALTTQTTDPADAFPAVRRRHRVLGIAAIILAIAGGGLAAWRLTVGTNRPAAAVDPLLRRVAVAYFTDNSPDHRLRPIADGLTEALIRSLRGVRTLTVVSRNGVAPFRGTDTPPDSIARAVNAGTLVEGSVEPEGKDRVRVTTRLRDGSGADVGKRTSFVVATSELYAAEDSVAQEVARTLREWLGQEVQLRERESGTTSAAAWSLLRRAESARKDAEQAARSDGASAATLPMVADSLLEQAEAADGRWIEPIILRGEIALSHSGFEKDGQVRDRWVEKGLGHAARALSLDGENARALALRGTLQFKRWGLGLMTDQTARAALLASAKASLESAVSADPGLASAYAWLSVIDYSETPADVFSALTHARAAYEADAYLSDSDFILTRLFWASYDTENFAEAGRWCDEGHRRFPKKHQFSACRLWMLLSSASSPDDIDLAWHLAGEVRALAPPAAREFPSHQAQLIVGGVIGRVAESLPGGAQKAMADSADRVLIRARADRTVDPTHELGGYEAIMRTQMGDQNGAIELLERYVAVNPDHSFEVAGNIHWWWRELRTNPGFQALLSRRR